MEILFAILIVLCLVLAVAWERAVSQRNYFRDMAGKFWEELQATGKEKKDEADWWKGE